MAVSEGGSSTIGSPRSRSRTSAAKSIGGGAALELAPSAIALDGALTPSPFAVALPVPLGLSTFPSALDSAPLQEGSPLSAPSSTIVRISSS